MIRNNVFSIKIRKKQEKQEPILTPKQKLLLLPEKAATAFGKSCYCFRKKLLLLPRKAATAFGKSCYCFWKKLLLLSGKAGSTHIKREKVP